MLNFAKAYDISITLGEEAAVYPGDPPFSAEEVYSLAGGAEARVSSFRACAHSGTHLDLPAHFEPGAPGLESFPPERFILPAQVLEIENPRAVTREELTGKALKRGRAFLFKTRNSIERLVVSGIFSEDYVSLEAGAAELCVELDSPLVGLDYFSIDRFGDSGYPVHRTLLNSGRLILEGLNLRSVPAGEYTLLALPLKIKGLEASPVRAVLLK